MTFSLRYFFGYFKGDHYWVPILESFMMHFINSIQFGTIDTLAKYIRADWCALHIVFQYSVVPLCAGSIGDTGESLDRPLSMSAWSMHRNGSVHLYTHCSLPLPHQPPLCVSGHKLLPQLFYHSFVLCIATFVALVVPFVYYHLSISCRFLPNSDYLFRISVIGSPDTIVPYSMAPHRCVSVGSELVDHTKAPVIWQRWLDWPTLFIAQWISVIVIFA